MPYIQPEERQKFARVEDALAHIEIRTPGELNYLLTLVVQTYFNDHASNYLGFNDVMGALSGAQQEFYRRVVAPYEDSKIAENGDVY